MLSSFLSTLRNHPSSHPLVSRSSPSPPTRRVVRRSWDEPGPMTVAGVEGGVSHSTKASVPSPSTPPLPPFSPLLQQCYSPLTPSTHCCVGHCRSWLHISHLITTEALPDQCIPANSSPQSHTLSYHGSSLVTYYPLVTGSPPSASTPSSSTEVRLIPLHPSHSFIVCPSTLGSLHGVLSTSLPSDLSFGVTPHGSPVHLPPLSPPLSVLRSVIDHATHSCTAPQFPGLIVPTYASRGHSYVVRSNSGVPSEGKQSSPLSPQRGRGDDNIPRRELDLDE